MSINKPDSDIVITSGKLNGELIAAFLQYVSEINDLLKIRSALFLGKQGESRTNEAVVLLNEEIHSRIDSLSANIIQFFKIRDIDAKK